MDFRQDAPRRGRAAHAAARSALCARARPSAPGDLERGLRRDREAREGRQAEGNRRHDRRPGLGRGSLCAQRFDDAVGIAQHRLPPGRRRARSRARSLELSLQCHDRRHRRGRRTDDHRRQSAQGGADPERAHPQALAHGRTQDRGDRREGRSHLRLHLSRRRARDVGDVREARARQAEKADLADRAGRDGAAVLSMFAKAALSVGGLAEGWNGFSVLHTAASRVGALDLGAVPGKGGLVAAEMAKKDALEVLFLLGADEIEVETGAFVVYVGTHGDRGAHRADVILPGAAYTEKSAIYVNTEGRSQLANRASFPPGEAREDWAILRALSDHLGAKLAYDSLAELRAAMISAHPHLGKLDQIERADPAGIEKLAKLDGKTGKAAFASPVRDFYLTNPIARASAVMAECSALAGGRRQAAE